MQRRKFTSSLHNTEQAHEDEILITDEKKTPLTARQQLYKYAGILLIVFMLVPNIRKEPYFDDRFNMDTKITWDCNNATNITMRNATHTFNPYHMYTRERICEILTEYSPMLFVGDSTTRRLIWAFEYLLNNETIEDSWHPRNHDMTACDGNFVLNYRWCVGPWNCGWVRGMDLQPRVFIYNMGLVQGFRSPIIMKFLLENFQAVVNLTKTISIWREPQYVGHLKEFKYTSVGQNNTQLLKYHKRISNLVWENHLGYVLDGYWNFTKDADHCRENPELFSDDGTHFPEPVNHVKLFWIVHFLEHLKNPQDFEPCKLKRMTKC